MFSTSVITVSKSTDPAGSVQYPPTSTPSGTPKMSVLLKGSNNIKVGDFGELEFCYNQAAFNKVFGDKPTILAQNIITSHDYTSTDRSLYSFG